MWGIKSNDSVRGHVQVPTSSAPRDTLQPFHKCLSVVCEVPGAELGRGIGGYKGAEDLLPVPGRAGVSGC